MAKVTGLGGVFWKVADPAASQKWYLDTLGIGGEWGALLRHRDDTPDGFAQVSQFKATTDYFDPSPHGFMINLRVDDLDTFVAGLEAKGIPILGRQNEDYGKFAWILDPDGVKVELWQQLGAAP